MVRNSVTEREKRLMAMGEMAASLAHEIRNPLGSMELYCSMLRKDLKEQPANLKLADQILKGIRNLERVVANSLQFARDMSITPCVIPDISAYLRDIVEYIAPIALEKGVIVELFSDASNVEGADPSQLQQVIINIILNAIDAAALHSNQEGLTDGSAASVKVCSQILENNEWQIQIMDNGVGIAADALDRVFDPFYSTKSNGTGLGMSVAYSIVKAHGGEVAIDSEVNKGTTVTVVLPAHSELK